MQIFNLGHNIYTLQYMFIALNFLIYNDIIHFHKFIDNGFINNCFINIHPKNKDSLPEKFKKYTVDRIIETKWNDRSIVEATLILLFDAYIKNNNIQWFILLSGDSYPLVNYNYVKNILLHKKNSMFDFIFQDKNKASQWFILNRNDVKKLLNAPKHIIDYNPRFTPDEYYFIHVLRLLNSKIDNYCSHYVKWPNWICKHPTKFNRLISQDIESIQNKNPFFIRKTFQRFKPDFNIPTDSCFLICVGTESIQNYTNIIKKKQDIFILSMIEESNVEENIKNNCIQYYNVVYNYKNIALKTMISNFELIYNNVIFIDEKVKIIPQIKNTQIKIAFLFLIIDDINHPNVWTNYFKEHIDNILIYAHPKNKQNVQTPWLKNAIIDNLVPTGWGFIVEAYLELIKRAYNDGATHFITISESCLPIYPLKTLLLFLNNNDSKTSYVNFKRVGPYDLNVRLKNRPNTIKRYVKHDARFCLSRFHAEKLLNSNLKYFINTQVGDEFFLSVLTPCNYREQYKLIAITYDNWEDIDIEVKKVKNEMYKLMDESTNKNQQIITELNNYINDIRKNPLTYTEINKNYIKRAYSNASFFWRKFPKTLNVEKYYLNNGSLIYD